MQTPLLLIGLGGASSVTSGGMRVRRFSFPHVSPAFRHSKPIGTAHGKHVGKYAANIGHAEEWEPWPNDNQKQIHKGPGQRDQEILTDRSLFAHGENAPPLNSNSFHTDAQRGGSREMPAFVQDHRNDSQREALHDRLKPTNPDHPPQYPQRKTAWRPLILTARGNRMALGYTKTKGTFTDWGMSRCRVPKLNYSVERRRAPAEGGCQGSYIRL